jgi:hypothetical protein
MRRPKVATAWVLGPACLAMNERHLIIVADMLLRERYRMSPPSKRFDACDMRLDTGKGGTRNGFAINKACSCLIG